MASRRGDAPSGNPNTQCKNPDWAAASVKVALHCNALKISFPSIQSPSLGGDE
jgi:hypothetical protein